MQNVPRGWLMASVLFGAFGLLFGGSFLFAQRWALLGVPFGLLGLSATIGWCCWRISRGEPIAAVETLLYGSIFFWAGEMLLSVTLSLDPQHDDFYQALIPSTIAFVLGALVISVVVVDRLFFGGAIQRDGRFFRVFGLVVAGLVVSGMVGLFALILLVNLLA